MARGMVARVGSESCSDHLIDFPRIFLVDGPDFPVRTLNDPIVGRRALETFFGANRYGMGQLKVSVRNIRTLLKASIIAQAVGALECVPFDNGDIPGGMLDEVITKSPVAQTSALTFNLPITIREMRRDGAGGLPWPHAAPVNV